MWWGNKVTVGAPFYNRVAIPIGFSCWLLTGVGRCFPGARVVQEHPPQLCAAGGYVLVMAIVCLAVGVRRWKDGAFDNGNFYRWWPLRYCSRADRHSQRVSARRRRHLAADRQEICLPATWLLTAAPTPRRYGGYIIHIGVVIVVIGLAGSAFNRNTESELALARTR